MQSLRLLLSPGCSPPGPVSNSAGWARASFACYEPFESVADGAALATATRRKEATYPEPLHNNPQRLVVLGSEREAAGHGSPGSHARPRSPPQAARPARSPPCSGSAWARRWWTQLSVAVQGATALSAAGRAWCGAQHAAVPSMNAA